MELSDTIKEPSRNCHYDPETHTYSVNGIELPSVTEILQSAGLVNTAFYTEESAWRGSVVHACCQYDDEGDLDEASVPEEAKGHLDAWRRFKLETGIRKFDGIEQPLFSPSYAGIPDRTGIRDGRRFVLDIKTGVLSPWVRLQLVGYGHLIEPYRPIDRIAVRLNKNGRYQSEEFPIASWRVDLRTFLNALQISHWKKVMNS